jgi:hypothetical protein
MGFTILQKSENTVIKLLGYFNAVIYTTKLEGGEKMSSKESFKEYLDWDSPIGVAVFFMGAGILIFLGAMTLQMIVSL